MNLSDEESDSNRIMPWEWEVIGETPPILQATPKPASRLIQPRTAPTPFRSIDDLTPGLQAPVFTNQASRSLQLEISESPLPRPELKTAVPRSLQLHESELQTDNNASLVPCPILVAEHSNQQVSKKHKSDVSSFGAAPTQLSRSRAATLRLQHPSQSHMLISLWMSLLSVVGTRSDLFSSVVDSPQCTMHCSRVLDAFAPSTVLKYLTAVQHFFKLCDDMKVQLFDMTALQMTDILIASSLSKSSDAAASGGKATIKALRWFAKLAMIPYFQNLAYHKLVDSILKAKRTFDRQETAPLCLWAVFQFERRILQSASSVNEILFLGACLIALYGGLRFADCQRMKLSSLVLGQDTLRGVVEKTKTTHRGQPFGLITQGLLSAGSENWCLKFLRTLDQVWHASNLDSIDSLFLQVIEGTGIEVLSYGAALKLLRESLKCPWRSSVSPLQDFAINFTLHSLKTTMLAWSVQVPGLTEEQRMVQGHHRGKTSLRIYSRDDVHSQLSLQRRILQHIQTGWRPILAQHRGAQLPMKEPPVQLERFKKEAMTYDWKRFSFSPESENAFDVAVSQQHPLEDPMHSSDDDSDSSESSSSSSASSAVQQTASQHSNLDQVETAEEVFVAWTTRIQHAVKRVDDPAAPKFDGYHYKTCCGSFLGTGVRIADSPQVQLQFCRRAACVKAWNSMST